MEIAVWKYIAESIVHKYMKRTWKLHYEFADARVN